jgi:hypothetical protein
LSSYRLTSRAVTGLCAAPAVVAVVGAVLPWFAPMGRRVSIPTAFCLQAGRIGFLAPLAIIGAALFVLGPRLGWTGKDRPGRSNEMDGLLIAGSGAVAGAVLVLTWYLLPSSYTFTAGLSWDKLNAAGHALHRGPQPGYFISIAAAVLAVGCGVLLVWTGRRESG